MVAWSAQEEPIKTQKKQSCSTQSHERKRLVESVWLGSFTDDHAFQYRFQFSNVKRFAAYRFLFWAVSSGQLVNIVFWEENDDNIYTEKSSFALDKKEYKEIFLERSRVSYAALARSTHLHYDSWSQHQNVCCCICSFSRWLFNSLCSCISSVVAVGMISKPKKNYTNA